MEQKLFLLDAYALIYRGFWALQKHPSVNSKGLDTTAVMGFLNQLEEVINKEKPSHIAVVFDPKGGTFRHREYPEYKAQRQKTPEGITVAIPYIKRILKGYNIPAYEVEDFEADDVIGTLAKKAAAKNIPTYMMTPDKDYGQLVQKNIFMYRPSHTGHEYHVMGEKEVMEKYGVPNPIQIIDLLGLMGDSSDNIPGCPGVGEKTAVKLIQQFGSIENLLNRTDELKGAMKTKLEENVDKIKLSKHLATIRTDVPIELNMEEMTLKEKNKNILREIFDELEFKHMAKRILGEQEKKPVQQDLFGFFDQNKPDESEKSVGTDEEKTKNEKIRRLENLKYSYQIVENKELIELLIQKILTFGFCSLDTETTSIDPMRAELVGLSFSVQENEAFYIPVPENRDEAQKIVNTFRPVYENEKIQKIGQNIKYDMIVLSNYGIRLKGKMFDTMLAHYLLHPELKHNMDDMAVNYLHYEPIHIEQLIGEGKKQKNMRDLLPSEVYEYAAEDADVTLQLKNILEKELEKENLLKLFEDIEMPLVSVLARMEMNGVRIDVKSLEETSRLFSNKMRDIEEEIYSIAKKTFNISSPKQVGEILFETLHLVDKPKKTKTGQYATSEEILIPLKKKHPIVEKILDYRGYKKLLSTYIETLPTLINPKTGYIHTSYNQAVTSTGRLSSSDPNLQNIPVREDIGKEVRKAFIPHEGCEFLSADYSQIELRVMAHISQDMNMTEAFLEGQDIHASTASKIYKKNINSISKDERRKAKTANFGIIYGITAFGLAERMDVTRTEAKTLIEDYFKTFPNVKEYMEKSVEEGRRKGYAETLFGRRCPLMKINSMNVSERAMQERIAINAPIQGTAADIIKIAMINIDKKMMEQNMKSKMILQVHDELNFSVVPEEREIMESLVKEEMERAFQMSVPLIADIGWGKNWLEAH